MRRLGRICDTWTAQDTLGEGDVWTQDWLRSGAENPFVLEVIFRSVESESDTESTPEELLCEYRRQKSVEKLFLLEIRSTFVSVCVMRVWGTVCAECSVPDHSLRWAYQCPYLCPYLSPQTANLFTHSHSFYCHYINLV